MNLETLQTYLTVVQRGSFSRAAIDLEISRATVAKRVDALEATTGISLLVRGSNGVIPTPAGAELAERGRHILADAVALLSSTLQIGEQPRGLVRLVVPVGIPLAPVELLVAKALSRWPDIQIGTRGAEDPFGELMGSADMALTVDLTIPSGPWQVHDLLPFDEILFASPDYLATRPPIRDVADLAAHRLLVWHGPGEDHDHLPLRDGTRVQVAPHLVTNRHDMVYRLAASGLGIGFALRSDLPALRAALPGPVRPVLAHLVGRQRWARLVVPEGIARLQRVKVVLDTALEVASTMRAKSAAGHVRVA